MTSTKMEYTPGVGDGQGGLAYLLRGPGGRKKSDITE